MDTLSTTAQPRAGARGWAALAALVLPVVLIAVDMTVLSFAVPHLTADLAPTGSQLLWIVDIYSFVLAGLLVTMGTLGDRIGRRRLLLIGSVGFGIASLMAAYAPSAMALIGARALLGLAGATLMPSTLSLIRNIFLDRRERMIAIAAWSAAFSAGAALGPIVGGALLERFWWGSVFLINIPVMVLLLVLVVVLVPESRDPKPGRYDLLSAGLSLAAMLPFVYGIKKLAETGLPTSVQDVAVVGTALAAGVIGGVLFIGRQRRLADPMIDVGLFRIRQFGVGVATNLILIFALTASLFFLTQYLQLVADLSPLRAGLVLVPGLALAVIGSFAAVPLRRRLSMGTVIVLGLTVNAAGFLLMTQLSPEGGVVLAAMAFAILGLGTGASDTVTNDAIMTAAPADRAGAASAISETAYELGGALGVAVLGSVLSAAYRTGLGTVPNVPDPAMDVARETLGGAAVVADSLPAELGPALLESAQLAFTDGVRLTSVIAASIVIVAAVQAGLLLRRKRARP
jgi:MFS transporter, DHA2 family, multidrug resistance protein